MTAFQQGPQTATRRRAVVALSAAVLLTAACGGSDGGQASSAGSGGRTVTISNFEFAPETLEAQVGDTITVVNKDSAEHTVTATDKSFDTGPFAGGTRTFTVTRPGRFEYVCEIHPFMAHKFIRVVG